MFGLLSCRSLWTGVGAQTRVRTAAGADRRTVRLPVTVWEAGLDATVTFLGCPVRLQLYKEV